MKIQKAGSNLKFEKMLKLIRKLGGEMGSS